MESGHGLHAVITLNYMYHQKEGNSFIKNAKQVLRELEERSFVENWAEISRGMDTIENFQFLWRFFKFNFIIIKGLEFSSVHPLISTKKI